MSRVASRRPRVWGWCLSVALAAGFAAAVGCSASEVPPPSGGAGTGGSAAVAGSSGASAVGGAGNPLPSGGKSGGPASAGTSSNPTGGGGASGGTPTAGGAGAGGSGSGGAAGAGGGVGRSNGCGKTPTMTFEQVPGESGDNVGFGEGGYVRVGNRGFAMRLPDNYDSSQPYWLVFGFHWRGGNAKEVDTGGTNRYNMAHYGLQKLSENGAIFVAPDGLNGGWGDSSDLGFVDDMVELITENYCVDTKHIFANGFSWGGGMSYALACARANVFRGVAIYNGAVLSGCEGGNDPIAYWQMAGLADTTCTVEQGEGMRDNFVGNNGCMAQNPPQPPPAPPYLRPGGHVCTTYTGCTHPLRWCVHQSGHGNAVVDGNGDLFHPCANPGNTCSESCPCTWVPEDVWTFFKSL